MKHIELMRMSLAGELERHIGDYIREGDPNDNFEGICRYWVRRLIRERALGQIDDFWFEDVSTLVSVGYTSEEFAQLLLDILAGKVKKPRGRPRRRIGWKLEASILKVELAKLRAKGPGQPGLSWSEAIDAMAERCRVSRNTILGILKKGRDAHD